MWPENTHSYGAGEPAEGNTSGQEYLQKNWLEKIEALEAECY